MYFRRNYYQEMEDLFNETQSGPGSDRPDLPSPDRLIQMAEEKISSATRTLSPMKKACFTEYAQQAARLAFEQCLDIAVISDDTQGIITMEGECLLFSNTGETWIEMKQIFLNLIDKADDVNILPNKNRQAIRLTYGFYDVTG